MWYNGGVMARQTAEQMQRAFFKRCGANMETIVSPFASLRGLTPGAYRKRHASMQKAWSLELGA